MLKDKRNNSWKALVADATVYKVSVVFLWSSLISCFIAVSFYLTVSLLTLLCWFPFFFFLSSSIACYIRFYHLERINLRRKREREKRREIYTSTAIKYFKHSLERKAWKMVTWRHEEGRRYIEYFSCFWVRENYVSGELKPLSLSYTQSCRS